MTPLVIALVVTFGIIILPAGQPYRRAAAITAVVSAIVLLKVFTSSDELDRYRVSLLGFRYAMSDSAGAPTGDTVFFGGPRDQIDFFIPGSDRKRLGAVTTTGTDSVEAIVALPVEDGSGVLMVIPPGERRWRIVGGMEEKSTIINLLPYTRDLVEVFIRFNLVLKIFYGIPYNSQIITYFDHPNAKRQ